MNVAAGVGAEAHYLNASRCHTVTNWRMRLSVQGPYALIKGYCACSQPPAAECLPSQRLRETVATRLMLGVGGQIPQQRLPDGDGLRRGRRAAMRARAGGSLTRGRRSARAHALHARRAASTPPAAHPRLRRADCARSRRHRSEARARKARQRRRITPTGAQHPDRHITVRPSLQWALKAKSETMGSRLIPA